ncbi:hypothetical protein D3C84_833170 [compost metagenome]
MRKSGAGADQVAEGQRWAVVLELEGVTDVARRRGGVAIAVGDGGRQRHQIGRQQACCGRAGLKRVERIVVHQRTVLGQRHVAGIGHHRDGERYGPGRISSAGGADPADDRAAFQEQVDLVARQGVHQAAVHAVRCAHAERVADRIGVLDVVVVAVLEAVLTEVRRAEQAGKAGGAGGVRDVGVVRG